MHDLYTQALTIFLGFFAIMNPIANTAAFAGLVGDKDKTVANWILELERRIKAGQ